MEYYHENVENNAGLPARISFGGSGRDRLRYPLHWHHNLEFDLVLEGRLEGKIGGREESAGEGEIFFVNSGELHETDARGQKNLRTVTILLSDTVLMEYCTDFDRLYFVLGHGSVQEKKIGECIMECAEVYAAKESFYELELDMLLRKLCLILLRECRREKKESDRDPEGYKSTKRIKKCISYMEQNFENNLSVEEMGRVMGMTPSYFSRFFKHSTGRTFHEYLTSIRLCRSQEMLEDNEKTVTEIAYGCGFPNVKSFIEAFKRAYGTTPGRYRTFVKDKK